MVWEAFRADYPVVEDQTPISPAFETFGPNPHLSAIRAFSMPHVFSMPRVLFMNVDKTQLLQVQKDRFLHNWRKIGESDQYPRFEGRLEAFELGFRKLKSVTDAAQLGPIISNQCEVTYINQIPVQGDQPFDTIEQAFASTVGNLELDHLGRPEDTRFLLRYVMRDDGGNPVGRLIINSEPGRLANGDAVLQLTLTARGVPAAPDIVGVSQFLQRGRSHIVRAFAKLTSQKMQKEWGRKQ